MRRSRHRVATAGLDLTAEVVKKLDAATTKPAATPKP
jgi:hypothetical protein